MNAMTTPMIELNALNKMVLVEMVKEIVGTAGDYARLSKEHYIEQLKKYSPEQVNTAFEAVRERAPKSAPLNAPVASTASAPVPRAASSAGDMLAEALKMLVPQAPIDEAAVRSIIGQEFAPLQSAILDRVEELLAKVEPQIQKIVVTPLGETKIDGVVHQAFDRVLKGAGLRQNVLLVGPAGCGKTKLAHQVADALKLPFASLSCSAGMSESQLLGWLLPVGEAGKFEYVASDFVNAYENGGVFLLDEIDAADENVLLVLNQALANGGFFLPQRRANPHVKRHPDFVCIAAANTFGHGADMTYAGRNRLDGATLDRFRANIIPMDYDAALEEKLIDANVLGWGRHIRGAIAEKKLRRVMSTRALLDYTAQKAIGLGRADWEASYFADWTRDELTKIGK